MMPEPTAPVCIRAAASPADCQRWLRRVDEVDAQLPASHPDRQAASGSLRLRALGSDAFDDIVGTLWSGAAGEAVRGRLRDPLCLVDQCWARRQFPPSLRPPGQHPHRWHQDGALGCRFDGPEPLAPLLTVWLALVECGQDAPSLEWIESAPPGRLAPAALDDALLAADPAYAVRRHARCACGDALVFGGALLHRTFVLPTMRSRRISLELRFVQAGELPQRLSHEPVVRCPR